MAESTLSVSYITLVREIARQLGYGLTYATGTVTSSGTTLTLTGGTWPSWLGTTSVGSAAVNIAGVFYTVASRTNDTVIVLGADPSASAAKYVAVQSRTNELTDTFQSIQDCIDEGYREFCMPPSPARDMPFYVWSWLLEQGSITLATSDYDYDLPDDFAQYMLAMTYALGVTHEPPEFVTHMEMRGKQSRDNDSGVPAYLTWRQKAFTSSTGRRFEALVHPTPASEVNTKTIEFLYRVLPNQLTPANLYPLCGAMHSDTLLKACQAAAERKIDNAAGVYAATYQERLAASIQADLAVKQTMGI
jgi:hypothetical protein